MTEAVIINAVRTPIGAHGGALKDVRPDDLAAIVIREVLQRSDVDPALVEEVFFGCANQAGKTTACCTYGGPVGRSTDLRCRGDIQPPVRLEPIRYQRRCPSYQS